ncbi:transketolase-like TK C-terminal-containing protein [Pseudomonas vanderleydeniana]|uniref:Pyruvate dehydrogenase n=1 Tax=Pseudomonas vanderleydeniana TaxID=2745495 RepID=A0A9E6PPR9_9PSED|nr:pyruvate dehydrogenase [Pseudomonas vanderleydeniana]QXI30441.1 pyruvate dehydrogenase [Pseudomonas vanderleydeniana]
MSASARSTETARACIEALLADTPAAGSPLSSVLAIADRLEHGSTATRQAWVIRNHRHPTAKPSAHISAWSMRFSRQRAESPLLYLLSAEHCTGLRAATGETRQRGIFCNDIETLPSRWPKGAQPSLPLWLAGNPRCQPFDPASGAEARAIVLGALQRLYVEGDSGFYYLALHDREQGLTLTPEQARDAFSGMYCLGERRPAQVRLLGAGRALEEVMAAARLLEQDWGVTAEVWSCPSYTRLARDAGRAERWNRLHPSTRKRRSHLAACLGDSIAPVIAVTGYPQTVVAPLAGHVAARFVGLGAGSLGPTAPDRHWITALALGALADEQQVAAGVVGQAYERYGLA